MSFEQEQALNKINAEIEAMKDLNVVCAPGYNKSASLVFDLGIPKGGRSTDNKTLIITLTPDNSEYKKIIDMLTASRDKRAAEVKRIAKKNKIKLDKSEDNILSGIVPKRNAKKSAQKTEDTDIEPKTNTETKTVNESSSAEYISDFEDEAAKEQYIDDNTPKQIPQMQGQDFDDEFAHPSTEEFEDDMFTRV